ncbi:hypothetical protein, partial [Ralstonia pseudosolanacearum]|uniref:hypothetical protein n=1 Tax=Ralstonia pseudosolanacearum TaxID=1310165 RepID=UPI0020058560
MFPAKIENLRRNPVCLQRYRHVVARKRQHGLTTTLIYATTPISGHVSSDGQSAQVYRIPRHPRLGRSSHCSQIFDGTPDGVGMPISFPWPRLFTDLVAHNPAYGCTAHCPRRTPAC